MPGIRDKKYQNEFQFHIDITTDQFDYIFVIKKHKNIIIRAPNTKTKLDIFIDFTRNPAQTPLPYLPAYISDSLDTNHTDIQVNIQDMVDTYKSHYRKQNTSARPYTGRVPYN